MTYYPRRIRRVWHDGFSLVELLTVIAVIGILASVLIPAIGSLRASADLNKTAANMRQIGQGIMLYASENNNRMPPFQYEVQNSRGQTYAANWRELVNDYLGDVDKRSRYDYLNNPAWQSPSLKAGGNHFGQNFFATQAPWGRPDPNYPQANIAYLSDVPNPSKVVILGEINHPSSHAIVPSNEPAFDTETTSRYRISHPGRRAVYIFADGHSEVLEGVRNLETHRDMWTW